MMATDNFETMNNNDTVAVEESGELNHNDKPPSENSIKHVLPLMYIQPGKLCPGQSIATAQKLVSTPTTPLSTIISSESSPVTYVVRHPITGALTTASSATPGQKRIIVRKQAPQLVHTTIVNTTTAPPPATTTTTTTATQINQNQATESGVATYVLTPQTKTHESVVLPAGTFSANQIFKPTKITPILPQFGQSLTSNNVLSQNSMTNIILPQQIIANTQPQQQIITNTQQQQQQQIITNKQPQQVITNTQPQQVITNTQPQQVISKTQPQQVISNTQQQLQQQLQLQLQQQPPQQNVLNIQFKHTPSIISKNLNPVLKESKTTNSTQNPPPLHPISRMTILNQSKNNRPEILKYDYPDAVLTRIPKKEEPEKRRRTISNILSRNRDKTLKNQQLVNSFDVEPDEKRKKYSKKQKLTYTLDINECTINNSDSNDKSNKDIIKSNDDITLMKVGKNDNEIIQNSNKSDDVEMELIRASTSPHSDSSNDKITKVLETNVNGKVSDEIHDNITNGNHSAESNSDPPKINNCKDGSGTLGTSIKNSSTTSGQNVDVENKCVNTNDNQAKDINQDVKTNKKKKTLQPYSSDDDKNIPDTFCTCESCGLHGYLAEFDSLISCSPKCTEQIEILRQLKLRKEKDNNFQRIKRRRRKEEKQAKEEQNSKENNEKDSTNENDDEEEIKEKDNNNDTEKLKDNDVEKEKEANKTKPTKKKDNDKKKDTEKEKVNDKDKELELKNMYDSIEEVIDKVVEESVDQNNDSKSESDSDTKDIITNDDDESQSVASSDKKYPWQKAKKGFSWSKYLEYCKAKAAPQRLFKETQPYGKNLFKVGMKLEGIDPAHPSHYCVLTVSEVVGNRIRLHFDGYPENFDYWVNCDSMDIFPVGWSEKNNHQLDPPKGYVASNFNWNAYLKTCKATAAPKNAFSIKNFASTPTAFRVGMKLEAVDRKHGGLICVASIAGVMDSRILVHFDSWDEVYDYWADASSPYIHPVGWCHQYGHSLTPPNNYKDPKQFTWDSYLRETKSIAAPSRVLKQRPPCGFKRGMKIEAVDKRVPQLVRVATIIDVKDHTLKIHFDGWPESHAYYVEDDSSDIHPQGWASKTGHPLEPPLTPEILNETTECGTPGCRGIGHIKGPKFAAHNSPSGCPYSPQNYKKIRITSDRLNVKHEIADYDDDSLVKHEIKIEGRIKDRSDRSERFAARDEKIAKLEMDVKQEYDDEFSDSTENVERSHKYNRHRNNSDGGSDDEEPVPKKRRKRRQVSEERNLSLSNSVSSDNFTSGTYAPNMPDKQLRKELYQSVYDPGYKPLPDAPHVWAKHSNALNRVVAKQNTNPRRWSNEEVIKFIQGVPNCKDIGSIFRKHSIDGEAFLMLTQEDLVKLLGLRLGPAIKLYNSIVLLRRRVT